MFVSVITKNLNWEILTKNLVTFKRWDEKFEYYGGSLKYLIFRGEFTKNQYIGGNYIKREGAWTVWRFRGGGGKKEEGGVFEGGGMQTMDTTSEPYQSTANSEVINTML